MSEQIIKSCPFCGMEPYYVEGDEPQSRKYAAAIVCVNPFCTVNPELVLLDDFRFRIQLKFRVIDGWNKRK